MSDPMFLRSAYVISTWSFLVSTKGACKMIPRKNLHARAFPVFEEVVYSFMQHEEDKVRLPFVAVTANGVSSEFWSHAWKSVLAEAGVQVGHGKPLLPVRTPDGWHPLHWTAEEATSWLRSLRQTGEVLQDSRLQLLGTHSCKSTCLSWLAKWGGIPDMRRLMGYYVADKMSTMLTYGKTTQVPLFVRSMLFWTPSRRTNLASSSRVAEISPAFTLHCRPDLRHPAYLQAVSQQV